MTATVEIYAVQFFRLTESKSKTKLCDICENHFIRNA